MARADFSDIDPGQTSGVDLADLLGDWADALISTHAGADRPTYAKPGTLWIKVGVPNNELMYFSGTGDFRLFELADDGAVVVNQDKFLRSDEDDFFTGLLSGRRNSNEQLRLGQGVDRWPYISFYNQERRLGFLQSLSDRMTLGVDAATDRALRLFASGAITWDSHKVWHAGDHGSGSGLDADLLDGLHAWQMLRRDIAANMLGRLSIEVPSDEQMRMGYSTGAQRNPYFGIYDGQATRRGFMQARSDRLRLQRDGGAQVDLFGSGDVRINGHRVNHAGDGNYTRRYTSSELTPVSGGKFTLSHGLGQAPRHVGFKLRCASAEHGFSVGHEVLVAESQSTQQSNRIQSVRVTSSHIYLTLSLAPNCFLTSRQSDGVAVGLTNSKWRFRVEAIA